MQNQCLQPDCIEYQMIKAALIEDFGPSYCDITSDLLLSDYNEKLRTKIIVKHPEPIRLCGLPVVQAILNHLSRESEMHSAYQDGQQLQTNDILCTLQGPAKILLMAERVVLNYLQHLCAIATLTEKFVSAVAHTPVKILDTRKTTPGLRYIEKYAVRCGGGVNHRMGLYDAIMIKDTHIDALGGVKNALVRLPEDILKKFMVIVEVRSEDECTSALAYGKNKITRILLDNMTSPVLRACVKLCSGKVSTEASGNISLANVREIADTGVDFISIGKLTHSAGSVDLSMRTEG